MRWKDIFGWKGKKESYDELAYQLVREDKKAVEFMDSQKTGCSMSVSGVGGRRLAEYLSKYHHTEFAPYADFPERLLCVLIDSNESSFGIPERDVMRVYVDIEERKVVAYDTLKWKGHSVSSRAHIIGKA